MANEPHRGVGQCPFWKSFCWLIGVLKVIDEVIGCMSKICREQTGKQERDETYHLLVMVDPSPREDNGASALRHFP